MTTTDNDFDPTLVAQGIVGLPILFAVNTVVGLAIEALVPAPAKLSTKIAVKVGRFVIASVASDLITDKFVKTNFAIAQKIVTNVKSGLSDIIQDEDDAQ